MFGSIGTAVYRSELTLPDLAPAAAAEATESLAGAATVATALDGRLATSLLDPAREAFTSGPHTVATIAAIIVAAMVAIGMVALRARPAVPPTGPHPNPSTVRS